MVDQRHLVRRLQEVIRLVTEEGVGEIVLVVQTHDHLRDMVLLDRLHDTAGHIHVETGHHAHGVIGRRSDLRRALQQFLRLLLRSQVGGVLIGDRQRIERLTALVHLQQDGELHQTIQGIRVIERYKDTVRQLLVGEFLVELVLLGHQLTGRLLRREGGDGAGDEDHHDGTVQDLVAQQVDWQPIRIHTDLYSMTDHHSRQGGSSLGIAQTEDHETLFLRHLVRLPRDHSGDVLGEGGDGTHHGGGDQRVEAGEDRTDINEHTHTYQEERNEDRIAHKVQTVHQRGDARDVPIQRKTHHEGTDDRLQGGHLREESPQEDHRQDEDILQDTILMPLEETVRYPRIDKTDDQDKDHHRNDELQPKRGVDLPLAHRHDEGEDDQGQRGGDHGTAQRYVHGGVLRHTETTHDRIGYQRVGGVHAGDQHGGQDQIASEGEVPYRLEIRCRMGKKILQEEETADRSKDHRHIEGGQAKEHILLGVLLKIGEVHLQARQEHDIEQTHRTEQIKADVTLQDSRTILAQNHTRKNQAYDMRNLQSIQRQRSNKNDEQHQRENQDWVCHR